MGVAFRWTAHTPRVSLEGTLLKSWNQESAGRMPCDIDVSGKCDWRINHLGGHIEFWFVEGGSGLSSSLGLMFIR